MSITVVLGVGLDPWQMATCDVAWRSAGFIVIPAASVREAIDHLQAGDFDLVLLGQSISSESAERLTFLIRASGSHVPVGSIASLAGDHDFCANKALNNNSDPLLTGMIELLAAKKEEPPALRQLQDFAI